MSKAVFEMRKGLKPNFFQVILRRSLGLIGLVNPVGLILGLLMSRIPYKRITTILNQISTIIPHHRRLG